MKHMRIYIYNEIPTSDLKFNILIEKLNLKCPFGEFISCGNFVEYYYSDKLIEDLANTWNDDLSDKLYKEMNPQERVKFESDGYKRPEIFSRDLIYNGWKFYEVLYNQLPPGEKISRILHVALTPRLLVTKGGGDTRFHARTIFAGQLSVISSLGLIEAPARPTGYYMLEAAYRQMGIEAPQTEIRRRFEGQFLTEHDKRLTDVIFGYVLQAIAYNFWGEGFCDDPDCRLFNAHLQKDLLHAQLDEPEFCPRHEKYFKRAGD